MFSVFCLLVDREKELGSNVSVIHALKYAAICILVTHLMACGWYSLACKGYHGASYGGNGTNGTWIVVPHEVNFDRATANDGDSHDGDSHDGDSDDGDSHDGDAHDGGGGHAQGLGHGHDIHEDTPPRSAFSAYIKTLHFTINMLTATG